MAVVIATSTAHLTPTVMVRAGELWDADDPIVKQNPGFFSEDLERYAVRTTPQVIEMMDADPDGLEDTTAEPGAKRRSTTATKRR